MIIYKYVWRSHLVIKKEKGDYVQKYVWWKKWPAKQTLAMIWRIDWK